MGPDVGDGGVGVVGGGCEVEVIFVAVLSICVAVGLGFISHLRFISFMIIKEDLFTFSPSLLFPHYYYQFMLRFNPEHQLILTPNPEHRLQATLSISNPSPRPAPFKVKSTRPSLFHIEPSSGFLLSNQTKDILITTKAPSTAELAHQISYHNKFMIEFALVDKVPNSLAQGLRMINESNRQEYKLFLTTTGRVEKDNFDSRSGISNRQSYRTVVNDEQAMRLGSSRNFHQDRDGYDGMNNDQKFEYLTREVERVEREKSELIMTSRPTHKSNIFRLILVLLVGVLLGNLLGKAGGLGHYKAAKQKRQEEQGWLSKLGLSQFWKSQETAKQVKSWWQFWK